MPRSRAHRGATTSLGALPGARQEIAVLSRIAALTPKQRTWIAVGLLLLVAAVPLRGLLRQPGPPMEEGFMLVFGESFLRGDVPNRDFLHLYGPGGVWVLAGAFELFGTTLTVERLVGLAQLLGIIFGVFFLARPWGRKVALVAGAVTALVIIPPIGLTALAWNGGLALGLLGCLAGLHATRATEPRRRSILALASGALLGAALLYRPDLVVAVGLVVLVLWRHLDGRARVRLAAGGAALLSLYLVHFAMAGIGDSIQGMVIDPIFHLRGGRRLPLPPSFDHFDGFLLDAKEDLQVRWPIPSLRPPAQLAMWFWIMVGAVIALVVTARQARRRAPSGPSAFPGVTLAVVAAFCVGILPQALQRSDTVHIAWVSCIPLGFLAVVGAHVARTHRPSWGSWRVLALGALPLVAALYLVVPNFLVRDYADVALETFGVRTQSHAIRNDGRVFYYGAESNAAQLAELLPVASRIAKPGDRLVVGTGDLRKTPLSEAFLYFLLPETRPGTFYIEMDPGVANASDSRLADDLRRADLVILSRAWDGFHEPNDSRELGSPEPNRVLRARFCSVLDTGTYELLRRCADGTGPVGGAGGDTAGR